MASTRLLSMLCAAVCFCSASACIFKFGSSPDSLSAPHGGTHWDHGFNGDDWVGVDAAGEPWTCMGGQRQSPINVPTPHYLETHDSALPSAFRTSWSYPSLVSNGSNVEVINNGHTIQVEWLSPYATDVKIVVPAIRTNATVVTAVLGMRQNESHSTVKATPLQFHFHSNSEHLVDGKYYPLELHIVHRIMDLPACAAKGGCFFVTGVLFELTDGGDNPLLNTIWAAMPMREGTINYLPAGAEINLGDLLPKPSDRDYVTYEGSLTTPPCSEGLLWNVMTQPQKISHAQWVKYKTAVGLKDCYLKGDVANTITVSGSNSGHHHHHHRRMLEVATTSTATAAQEEPVVNPNDYTCDVIAYGSNFRASQKLYGRPVKIARGSAKK